jgi:hypothetical protein
MAQGMVQGYREIMSQSERIRQMIEANAAAMEEVTRSHKEIQDGVAGVDRTIRTILEVSRDLREMTGSLAKTFSWFEEVLAAGEQEGAGEILPIVEAAEEAVTETAAAQEVVTEALPIVEAAGEIPELEGEIEEGPEAEELEEVVELVEALEEEEQPERGEDLFLAEDLDELGVTVEVLDSEEPPAAERAVEEAEIQAEVTGGEGEQEASQEETFDLEDVEELEAVEEEVEELEGVDSSPGQPATESRDAPPSSQ